MPKGNLITLGSFDGVHLGHAALLERTVKEAKKRKLTPIAVTFLHPPRHVMDRRSSQALITSPVEKDVLLRRFGIKKVVTLEFNKKLAQVRSFSFFRDILVKQFHAKGIVIGMDFRFGANRSAGAAELVRWGQEYEIPVWVIPSVKKMGAVISSTRIRQLLRENRYPDAARLLGHPSLIRGCVVKGRGVGTKLGIPTANLVYDAKKILPNGVFAISGRVMTAQGRHIKGGRLKGVCNIGVRPTFLKKSRLVVEAHFFGKRRNLLGKILELEIQKKIRDEKRFPSKEALIKGIHRDMQKARYFHGKGK